MKTVRHVGRRHAALALGLLAMMASMPLNAERRGGERGPSKFWELSPARQIDGEGALGSSLRAWLDPEAEREIRRTIILQGSGGSFLGVGVQEIDAERAKALGLKEERGVEITRVEENSPASKAGLQKGDVVLEYNGQRVEGTEQFIRLVRETPVGRTVKLQVFRNGTMHTFTATTEARKHTGRPRDFNVPFEMPEFRLPDMPRPYMGWRSGVIGVEGEALDSQLAEFFGVKEGVLVRSVVKGSPAEKAGIKAGDVIVKVEGEKVATPRDISNALRRKRSGGQVPLTIVREKREMNVAVTIEDVKSPGPPAPPSPRRARPVKTGGIQM